jgi:hypothetical protein
MYFVFFFYIPVTKSTFHIHSRVFNHEHISHPKMGMKCSLDCSWAVFFKYTCTTIYISKLWHNIWFVLVVWKNTGNTFTNLTNFLNFICVKIICCWKLLRYWMFTSDVVMEARASSDLSFIGMWNISFIIMWPLHNQSYCNISMGKNKNLTALKSNSNTVWFNFQTYIYINVYTLYARTVNDI